MKPFCALSIFCVTLFFFLGSSAPLFGQTADASFSSSEKPPLGKSSYAAFLNACGATDGLHGYDAAQAILREGSPGSYYYTARSEEKNQPVHFVSMQDLARYCDWRNAAQLQENRPSPGDEFVLVSSNNVINNIDPCLKSSALEIQKVALCSMALGKISLNPKNITAAEEIGAGVIGAMAFFSLFKCVGIRTGLLDEPEQFSYSKESVQGTEDESRETMQAPAAGYFQAGSKLRRQLAKTLFTAMVEEATTNTKNAMYDRLEPRGISQSRKDIPRSSEFTLTNEHGDGALIGFQMKSDEDDGKTKALLVYNAFKEINELTGRTNADLAIAIISLSNQIFGAPLSALSSCQNLKLQAEHAVGFPDFAGGSINYSLEKLVSKSLWQGDQEHYLLTYKIINNPQVFFLKKSNQEIEAVRKVLEAEIPASIQSRPWLTDEEKAQRFEDAATEARCAQKILFCNDDPKIKSSTFLSLKITPHRKFNPEKKQTLKHFPCSLEVLDFHNEYTTALSRGELENADETATRRLSCWERLARLWRKR